MHTRLRARLVAAAMVCLWTTIATAQEPAVPPAAIALPEEPSAAPAAESTPTPEATPAPKPGAKRIVVLPVEFTVYERSVSGVEAVPDWSESAQFALGDAAGKMLRLDNRFEIVAMPKIEGESAASLSEHVELFKIISTCLTGVLQYGGKAWEEKKKNFDYTLGDGLRFLADAAQADYALILAGAQVKQTGGSAFMQFLVGTPGGGTFVAIGVVNLRTGDLAWFNWKQGMEMFGMTGSDVRDPVTAQAVVAKMFEEYPNSKLITFKPF